MTTFSFAPATREQSRARIGLQGPAGCGKTKTALRIAEGLAQGGLIGVVDTERRSALTYAVVPGKPHLGGHEFLHMPMDSYDPRNLILAVEAAEKARIAVLAVDSWSHFWIGRGGLLEIVDQAGGGAGSFGGWRKGNPIEQDMLTALLNFSGHLIVTMRTKTDYVIDGTGPKAKITKVGTKTVQREGTDYELGLIIDMVEGTGTVTKTRYEPLEGLTIHHPGEELGQQILEQLGQGVDPIEAIRDQLRADDLTYAGALEIHERAKQRGLLDVEAAHPVTAEVMTLGDAIRAVGVALKPASAPSQDPPAEQAQPSAAEPPQAQNGAISGPMMRKIFALLKAVGVGEDRDERLRAVSLMLGKPVGSMNELAHSDGAELIDTLATFDGAGGRERFAESLTKLAAEFAPAA